MTIFSFKSGLYNNGLGFQLFYESSNVSEWSYSNGNCGGSYTTRYGILTSPSYPDEYPNNADCIYTISQPNGTSLILKVLLFELNDEVNWNDNIDFLEIRDGHTKDSPLIGKFCGSNIPLNIQSTQNNLWMK